MKLTRQFAPILVLCATFFVSACSKGPMDTPLVMGKGFEAFKVDIGTRAEKMSSDELNAYNWAVDGMSYERLIEVAPNKTPREVIRMKVADAKREVEQGMAFAEKAAADFEEVRADLQKITASDVKLHFEKGFHGHMPHVNFKVANGSRYDIGTMGWVASLRINGSEKPEATKALSMYYKNSQMLAMRSGQSYSEQHQIGFVSGDAAWTTQTVLQADNHLVTVEPDLAAIRDLEGNRILPESPYPRLEQLRSMAKAVELYGSI